MAAIQGLNIINEGMTSYFRRPGYQGTIPDIFMTSEELTENVEGWTVIEDYTGSDHQYIVFQINSECQKRRPQNKNATPRWNIEKTNEDKLLAELANGRKIPLNTQSLICQGQVEEVIEATMRLIQQACRVSMQ